MADDRILTVDEVAERLRLEPETVRRMLRDGRLRGSLLSRRAGWRVQESALRELLDRTENRVD